MADLIEKNALGPVAFKVYANGSAVAGKFGFGSISVAREVNRIGRASVEVIVGDETGIDVQSIDDAKFKPGNSIRIDAGYGSGIETIYEGIVISNRLRQAPSGVALMVVECRDYAVKAASGCKNKVFSDKKDSEIISLIAGSYPDLAVSVDDTSRRNEEVVQCCCNDWDFILSLAVANGMVAVSDGRKLSVGKPGGAGTPTLTVKYGGNLLDFDCEAVPDGIVSDSGLPGSFSRFRGNVQFQGNAKAKPGCFIGIEGLGKIFNGNAFASKVVHTISDGVWITTAGLGKDLVSDCPEIETGLSGLGTDSGSFGIGMNPGVSGERGNVTVRPSSGFLPGFEGLQVGKVTKLDSDPAGENRIQVSVCTLGSETVSVWARLANFYGTSGASGSFFIPEIGDEVVLGFFNGYPGHPVILGSLYGKKNAPPYGLSAGNNVKAIVSRSKLVLEMDEDRKSVTLKTPGGNEISICDESKAVHLTDQNGNKISMDASGIRIDSCKDVIINAKSNINLAAVSNIETRSKADTRIYGMNVIGTADVGMTLKGNATAEISAAGQTVVKGAMVMIN